MALLPLLPHYFPATCTICIVRIVSLHAYMYHIDVNERPTLLPRHVPVTRPTRRNICLPSFLHCRRCIKPLGLGTPQFLPKHEVTPRILL